MKKFKKIAATVVSAAVLISSATAVSAGVYGIDKPSYEFASMAHRNSEFTDGFGGYDMLTQTGGTITVSDGWAHIERTESSGALNLTHWFNGAYNIKGDVSIGLKVKKNRESAKCLIRAIPNDSIYIKWESDGALYGMYRQASGDGEATAWNYIGKVDGLEAEFFFAVNSDDARYSMWVNDKCMLLNVFSKSIYGMNEGDKGIRDIGVYCDDTAVGDIVSVDYISCGSYTNFFAPAGVAIDKSGLGTTDNISVTQKFVGMELGEIPAWTSIVALYNNADNRLEDIKLADVSKNAVRDGETTNGSVTQAFDVSGKDYGAMYVRAYVWKNNVLVPVNDAVSSYLITKAVIESNERTDEFTNTCDPYTGTSGGQFENAGIEITEGAAKTYIADNKLYIERLGEDGYAGVNAWMAGGWNKKSGIVTFTLTKTPGAKAFIKLMPSDYVCVSWNEDGSMSACYRNSADEQGPDAKYYQIVPASDDLEKDIVVAFNGDTSTYTMWVDDVPVVVNKYSRAIYNESHSVPTFINMVRLYSEGGDAGDKIAISHYRFGYSSEYPNR